MTTMPHQAPTMTAAGARSRWLDTVTRAAGVAVWALLGAALGLDLSGFTVLAITMLAGFQVVVRRRPLRTLTARDSTTFAAGRSGRVLVAAVLLAVPATMALLSIRGGRYADDGWQALLMAVVLVVGYTASRRLVATVLVATAVVAVVSWALAPDLASTRSGDRTVLAQLDGEGRMGMLAGYHDLAVAEVDLDATRPVRTAGIGADDTTLMEVGSMTKAMTGLVIADSVRRGEIRMDVPVSLYLPELVGSPAGDVTMHELVTHTSGFAQFGGPTLRRAAWRAPLGLNFLTADREAMTREVRGQALTGRGDYAYSTLGAATAGQAAAAAAGMSYADLMRIRLFEPLGMAHTSIEEDHALVDAGRSASGLPVRPWVFGAYAPGGAAVSTAADLAKLATALLDGTAPGLAALHPTTDTGEDDSRVGDFWISSLQQTGRTVVWHNGQTGGYASYLGLDLAGHRAVIVLSDVALATTTDLGFDLLAQGT